jgi:zinc protease
MKKHLILLLLLICSITRSQQIPELETYSLKNGMKIFFLKYGKIEAMHASFIINSGKKNETPGQQGLSDLTAQLVMSGNRKYSEEQQNDKAFEIGAEINTSSNFDYTTISSSFLSKDAGIIFDLISAAMQQPLFDKEKVAQQISSIIDNNQPTKMDNSALARIYSSLCVHGIDNPLGRNVYKKQLSLISPGKITEYHQFNYSPKNTRIIISGNYNTPAVKAEIEKYFGSWQSTYNETNAVALELPQIKQQEYFFVNRSAASQCALRWTKTAPAVKNKDLTAFTIANRLFNQVLFKEIREKGGKTYSIHSGHQMSQFSNLMQISCSVRNNEMLNTITLFDQTLQQFHLAPFTKEELEIEITKYKNSILSMEHPEQVAAFYSPMVYNFETRKNVVKELENLKYEEVQKVVKKYFTPGVYKLVISGDEQEVKEQLSQIKNLKKFVAADLELKN